MALSRINHERSGHSGGGNDLGTARAYGRETAAGTVGQVASNLTLRDESEAEVSSNTTEQLLIAAEIVERQERTEAGVDARGTEQFIGSSAAAAPAELQAL